eukprot:jgi/Botrbrau1/9941/Bobra.0012s0038.1
MCNCPLTRWGFSFSFFGANFLDAYMGMGAASVQHPLHVSVHMCWDVASLVGVPCLCIFVAD